MKSLLREKKHKEKQLQSEKEAKIKAINEEKEKEQKERKIEELKKRIEQKHNDNKKIIDDWEQKYKDAKPTDEYLYQKAEKKARKIKLMQTKKIKQKINQIKQQNIPINFEGIEEHEQKYISTLKENEEKREKAQMQTINTERNEKKQQLKYHNSLNDLAAEEFKHMRYKSVVEKEEKKAKVQKMKKVAVDMQEQHKPKISEKKRQQIEEQIMQLEGKEKRGALTEVNDISEEDPENKRYPWRKYMSKHPHKESLDTVLPEIKKPITYRDYLTEERIKNPKPQINEKEIISNLLEQRGIPFTTKVERVKEKVREMEEKANRKMQLIQMNKNCVNQDLFKEASEIYIDSIKAKISLLHKVK